MNCIAVNLNYKGDAAMNNDKIRFYAAVALTASNKNGERSEGNPDCF
jgi:hypothetical protein